MWRIADFSCQRLNSRREVPSVSVCFLFFPNTGRRYQNFIWTNCNWPDFRLQSNDFIQREIHQLLLLFLYKIWEWYFKIHLNQAVWRNLKKTHIVLKLTSFSKLINTKIDQHVKRVSMKFISQEELKKKKKSSNGKK